MKTKSMWLAVLVAAALVLMAGGAGALAGPTAPEVAVASKINYQGRLTDPGGAPLNGTFPMIFQIYDDPGAGALLWDSGVLNVGVDHGLFNVALAVDPAAFNGRALWLWINVNSEWLWPRQELLPVPYALSLRPGARIEGDATTWVDGWVLDVHMNGAFPAASAIRSTTATGSAVYGNSDGYGLSGYSEIGNAIVGRSNQKTAGVFSSNEGYGIQVSTNGTNIWDHAGYFTSNWGYGVYAKSTYNYGVFGEGRCGVIGQGVDLGVSGSSTDGAGVDGTSTNYNGVNGTSTNYDGVSGWTWRGDSNYGLHTYANLYSGNIHTTGAVMHVVQNGDAQALERGDLVAIAGLGASPAEGIPPLIQVRKAHETDSLAVIGVVASTYSAEWLTEAHPDPTSATAPKKGIPLSGPGPIAPGEYLLIVVQGPAQVKASALSGAIQPGDPLSSGGQAGCAVDAVRVNAEGVRTTVPGTVFGKALEPLDAGQKLIYVFVTLQ